MSANIIQSRTLEQWVDYIQGLHHRQIELSLERVRAVYQRLLPRGLDSKIITLAGTNGKGSTAELLASIYRQAGYRVGKYTSPHLCVFNERVNLNGQAVDDQMLLDAFENVEAVRQDTPITFFEYGTLVAIDIFARSKIDVAILEVGLGGRLDAVNILDADAALITSVSIDHTAWLGNTIEQIAYEKAGVARPEKPLIIGMPKPPQTVVKHAADIGAELQVIGQGFDYLVDSLEQTWAWYNQDVSLDNLPLPYLQSGEQLSNCALALQAISHLHASLPVTPNEISQGIGGAEILGRCQVVQDMPLIIVDVSHNQASVSRLANFVNKRYSGAGRVMAVCGMLQDKEIELSLAQLSDQICEWFCATIHNERGAKASDVKLNILSISDAPVHCFEQVELAYSSALATLTEHDCLLVFGSFHIAGDILKVIDDA